MQVCLTPVVNPKLPLIPVLLPGTLCKPELPLFLGEVTWVDLPGGVSHSGLHGLVYGMNGEEAGRGSGGKGATSCLGSGRP